MRDDRGPLTLMEAAEALGLSTTLSGPVFLSADSTMFGSVAPFGSSQKREIEAILRNAVVPALETLNGKHRLPERDELIHEKDATGRLQRQIEGSQ